MVKDLNVSLCKLKYPAHMHTYTSQNRWENWPVYIRVRKLKQLPITERSHKPAIICMTILHYLEPERPQSWT